MIHIGLICEGPTDHILIGAVLRAIVMEPFVITPLSLATSRGGWGGVLAWCDAFAQRHYRTLHEDPTLQAFDLILLHLDADVARCHYRDVLRTPPKPYWLPLPLPFAKSVESLLLSWLHLEELGEGVICCIPAQNIETWLWSALHPHHHTPIEDHPHPEHLFKALPKKERFPKNRWSYHTHAHILTQNWESVTHQCSQARQFDKEIRQWFALFSSSSSSSS